MILWERPAYIEFNDAINTPNVGKFKIIRGERAGLNSMVYIS